MDLKVYYQKLRQIEASLQDADVVVVSLATPDGGRAGVSTEAPRAIAARLIAEGGARLASEEEAQKHREQHTEVRRLAEQAAAASRIQVTVVSEAGPREDGKRQKPRGKSGQE
jgi:hypothetical protein